MSGEKISLSLGKSRKAPPPTNGVKRPRAALHEEDDETNDFGKTESVSHFDKKAGGAIDERNRREDPQPIVIPRMANRNWKEAANKRKRQKSGLPEGRGREGDIDQRMAEVEAAEAAKMPSVGLNLSKKDNDAKTIENGHIDSAMEDAAQSDENEASTRPKTDDELAMDALLGKTSTNKQLVIEAQHAMTEADAFQHDYDEAPDMATLDDYARVPVEDFGAAMLRGMGWKEGEGIGSQKGKKVPKTVNKLPERRANLLGIGAKEDAAIAQEMGVWGKAAKGGKEVKIYNPVLLKNKKTGEMYTEEELQKKREQDERAKYEEEFERKEKERERKRRKEDEYDRDSKDRRRHKDDRRDGDRDRRKNDDESDDEYYRRKEKERRRRRERDSRDEDYRRSRHHDESRHHNDRRDRDYSSRR